jgi:lipopolysaccharide/colanic/teichoic acid biosynthesis glycosyltransferase
LSTSVAAEVELAPPEKGDIHAPAPLSLVPAPNGTIAATGFLLERPRLRRRIDAAMIRTLDALVAAVLLLVLLPFIVMSALAVRLDSPGPAFFRVERIGWRGGLLRMLKFRKMHDDAEGPALTIENDARFTRLGPLLARLKLDELPQLWHVLTGDMSLVGPRPESPEFVALHDREYATILSVRPGVTGLSQIAFAEESRILDDSQPVDHYVGAILPQKVALDVMYARERSCWLNVRILFWTAAAVVMRRQVAVHRETGQMNLRKR